MQSSSLIIAINKDHDAPIFKFADHGIVGDFRHIIPEMIEQIKSRQTSKKREGSTVG
jgi:electron transfer flavoprotein alpha subunit